MDNKKHGGYRKGAGRPPKQSTLYAQQFRDVLAEQVCKKVDEYIAAWEALALGHKVLITSESGEEIVYLKSPNVRALQTITDRAFGRPEQFVTYESDIEVDLLANIPSSVKKYEPKLISRN